jgi:hypothetical protein
VVDPGANFPCKTNGADFYEFGIWCPSFSNNCHYYIHRLNTDHFFEGTATTNLPANNTGLSYQIGFTNNATASAVSMDISSIYIENDN